MSKKKHRKPKEYLFIDGYNIINSWSMFEETKESQLEEARNKLVEIIMEYQSYSGIDTTIVFDAHLVKGNSGTKERYGNLKVVYTKESETADHYIERKLDKIGKIKRVRVATSDWVEQQIVLGRGGTRISARELEIEVFNGKKLINKNTEIEKQKNNFLLGQLDEETIKKLSKWNLKKE